MQRRNLCNPANALTLARFAAAPFMVWLALLLAPPAAADRIPRAAPGFADGIAGGPATLQAPPPAGGAAWVSAAALALLALTLATDMADGWVARRMKIVTDFGKIMDPVADSTFFMTALFALAACPRFRDAFPVWIPLVVLYREVAMQVLRRYGALRGKVMAAKWAGKVKMFVQSALLLAFFALLAWSDHAAATGPARFSEEELGRFLYWFGLATVALNVLSLAEYGRDVPALISEWQEPATDRKD